MTDTAERVVELPLESITVGNRHRKDMGDLSSLIDSIETHGLLQPIGVDESACLVFGERRLEAHRRMGLTTIACRVIDLADPLGAELDENECRKNFSPTELYEIGQAIEARERVAARAREHAGKKLDPMFPGTQGSTRDAVGTKLGISGSTYERIKTVVEAAKEDPERFAPIQEAMDAGEMSVKAAAAEVRNVHVSNNSGNNEWYTPSEYIELARRAMGSIDCDPASSEVANELVKADTYYTAELDGLSRNWRGNVWLNPPYSQPEVSHFCQKAAAEYLDGNIKQACVLVNNATETAWFQDLLNESSAVCFVRGRIKYLDETLQPKNTPLQGQAVIYLGTHVTEFFKAFSAVGVVMVHG